MQSLYSIAPAECALVGGILLLCRDVVAVFYVPSRMGPGWGNLTPLQRCSRCILRLQPNGSSLGKSFLSAEMQSSVYSMAPGEWVTRWRNLTPLQRCSRCILRPQPNGPGLGESYLFAEMQPVYSTARTEWALVGGILPFMQPVYSTDPAKWVLVGGILPL